MSFNLRNRSLLAPEGLPAARHPLPARPGRRSSSAAKAAGNEHPRLRGKNIALIFEKASTRTRCAFEVAVHDQGGHVTYLDSAGSQLGHKESLKDTARVLGRLFDGIEYRGFHQSVVRGAGPVLACAGVERPDRRGPPDPGAGRPADDAGVRREAAARAVVLLPGRCPLQHGLLAAGGRHADGHGRAHRRAAGAAAARRTGGADARAGAHHRRAHHARDRPASGGGRRRLRLHRRLGLDGRSPTSVWARAHRRSCCPTRSTRR